MSTDPTGIGITPPATVAIPRPVHRDPRSPFASPPAVAPILTRRPASRGTDEHNEKET